MRGSRDGSRPAGPLGAGSQQRVTVLGVHHTPDRGTVGIPHPPLRVMRVDRHQRAEAKTARRVRTGQLTWTLSRRVSGKQRRSARNPARGRSAFAPAVGRASSVTYRHRMPPSRLVRLPSTKRAVMTIAAFVFSAIALAISIAGFVFARLEYRRSGPVVSSSGATSLWCTTR